MSGCDQSMSRCGQSIKGCGQGVVNQSVHSQM